LTALYHALPTPLKIRESWVPQMPNLKTMMLQVWRLETDYVGNIMAMFFPADKQETIRSRTKYNLLTFIKDVEHVIE
jgi:hypothetical protein